MTDMLLPPQEKAGTPGVDPSPLVASGVPSPLVLYIIGEDVEP